MPRYTLLLFTVLTLLLAACGGGSTTPTLPEPNPPTTPPTPPAPPEPEIPALTLSGMANGYVGAEGTLVASMQNSLAEVATGTISADGSFTLELPGELSDDQLSDNENYTFCKTNPVDVSSATWEADLLALLEVRESGAATGQLLLSNAADFADTSALTGLKRVTPVYSASALSVTGDCGDNGVTLTYNMQLQTGWNYVVLEATNDDASSSTLSTVPSLPTDVRWDFLPPSSPFSASGVQDLPQWTLKRR